MPPESPNSSKTAAENIKILSQLSESIPTLLHSAGSALSLLTDPIHSSSDDSEAKQPPLPADDKLRRELFTAHVQKYYSTLRQVQTTLISQTSALEEEGIIPADAPTVSDLTARGGPSGFSDRIGARSTDGDSDKGLTNGGMGKLEVTWLKSQSKDISEVRERELVQEAKEWLQEEATTTEAEHKDEAMADG
jgi:hypothetical protein